MRLGWCYGVGHLSLGNTAAWAEMSAVATVSDVALLNRLRRAAPWFGQIVAAQGAARRRSPSRSWGGAWAGRRLRLVDGTTVSHPGSAGMVVADRGFAKGQGLHAVVAATADVLVRIGWKALTLHTPDGRPFDLCAALRALPDHHTGDGAVVITGGRRAGGDLPVHWLIKRKTAAEAERSRQSVRRGNSKKGSKTDPRSLEAAGYLLAVTSLDAACLPAEQGLEVSRLRWQIEMAFKRLKGLLRMEELPAKDPDLARAWLTCQVRAALLSDDLTRHVRDSFPCAPSDDDRRGPPRTLALADRATGPDGPAAGLAR